MSIELKRNLLRISREKSRNPNYLNINANENKEEVVIPNQKSLPNVKPVERIKTRVKTKYLGPNLNPDYINKYKGESFIIAGCGSSLNYFNDFSDYYVIGVNDIERILTPDFLIVVNDHRTFMRGRWDFVRETQSPIIFSHLDNPGPITRSSNLVKIKIGKRGIPNLDDYNVVDHTMNSPYMAAIIAYQLGAKKIAMVGVDFTQNHFFSETGAHKLSKNLKTIDEEYSLLRKQLEKKGVMVANISPISMLESWPKMSLEQFKSI